MNKTNIVNKNMIILFVILLIILVFIFHFNLNKDEEEIQIVKDNSTFFTVSSCVSKYLNAISSKNTDNLLILLDDKYKKKYNIDAGTVYDHTGYLDGNYTFKGKKMYFEKVGKSRYKYYVYGVISKDIINTISEEEDYYIIVYLNEKNMTFSIEPYDGEIFNN